MTGDPDGAIPSITEEQNAPVFYDPRTGQPIPKNMLESYRGKQVFNGIGETVYYGESPNFGGDFMTLISELFSSLVGWLNGNHTLAENGHMVADWEKRYGPEVYVVDNHKPSALDTADASGPFRTAAAEPTQQTAAAPNPAPKVGV